MVFPHQKQKGATGYSPVAPLHTEIGNAVMPDRSSRAKGLLLRSPGVLLMWEKT